MNSTIDWAGQLEAYHEDGWVYPAVFKKDDGTTDLPVLVDIPLAGIFGFWAQRDGQIDSTHWRIRNVPQPTPQADTKPDLTARMVALVRRMAMADKQEFLAMGTGCREAYAEADAIVALLPEPVDPDLIEAREIAAVTHEESGEVATAGNIRAGNFDSERSVGIARRALARGRALALAGEKEA